MKKVGSKSEADITLRRRAEELHTKKTSKIISHLSETDILKLIHELEVYQIELELQNEELLLAKEQAEIASKKFTELYDFAPSGYFTLSKEGKILELNLIGAKMLDKERKRLIASSFGFFVSNNTKSVFNLFLDKVFSTESKETCEVILTTPHNLPINVLIEGISTQDTKECLLIVIDITEFKRAEKALLWNETLLKLMANSSPLGYIIVDNRTDKILYFNERFCEIWGIEHLTERMHRGELKNSDIITDCLPILKDISAFTKSSLPLQNEENRIVIEDDIPFTDGRTVRRFSAQIRGGNDEYYGRFHIFEDITKVKYSEEIAATALAKEVALNELKSRFISTASHEFRTPLTSILSSAELLEYYGSRWSQEKKVFHLTKIQRSVGNLQEMLNDVIFLGRAESNKTPVDLIERNLHDFCDQLMEEYLLSKQRDYAIEYSYNLKADYFIFDNKLLRQILTNLIGNAIKYTHTSSPIIVSVDKEESGVQFIVSDKGIGIPEEEQKFIFDPFFRARNSIEFEGTGLGLPIVKRSVDAHGGGITFISKENEGTTFFVLIPTIIITRDNKNEKDNFSY